MHLPHDPMVSDFSYLSFLSLSLVSIPTIPLPRPNPKKRSITRDSAAPAEQPAPRKRRFWNFVIDTGGYSFSRILRRRTREFDEEVDRLKPKGERPNLGRSMCFPPSGEVPLSPSPPRKSRGSTRPRLRNRRVKIESPRRGEDQFFGSGENSRAANFTATARGREFR